MRMPSASARKSLEKAVTRYQVELPRATAYLAARGISEATAELWRLGVVGSPETGHEFATGRLCIPYTNRLGIIGVKFRCLQRHDCRSESCPKYVYPLGQEAYLFNVLDTDDDGDTIHICEGELDTIVLKSVLQETVVGIPGVQNWKSHYPCHVKGFERVLVWADGDKAGQDFAAKIRKEVAAAETVPMPTGYDVSQIYSEMGAEAIRKLAGADEND